MHAWNKALLYFVQVKTHCVQPKNNGCTISRHEKCHQPTLSLSLVLVRLRPDICVLLISSNSNAFLLSAFFLLLCDKFISFILISECINNRINCNHFSQFLISCTRAWIVNFYFFGGGGREREKYENDCRERHTEWASGVLLAGEKEQAESTQKYCDMKNMKIRMKMEKFSDDCWQSRAKIAWRTEAI